MRGHIKVITTLALAAVTLLSAVCASAGNAPARSISQQASKSMIITLPVVLQWPKQSLDSRFMVNDQNGATMFNVNGWGAYSTGLGRKMPDGELCTTYGFTNKVGCFLPNDTMILQSTGPNGPTGPVETLTAPMIESLAWLISKIPGSGKLIGAHPSW